MTSEQRIATFCGWGLSTNQIHHLFTTRWWQLKDFLFSPRNLGKVSNLTNIFQMGWNHQLVTNMSPFFMPHVQKERRTSSKHYFSVDLCFVPGNGLQDGQLEVWVTRNVFRRGQEDYPFDSWIISITNSVYCLGWGHFSPCFDVFLVFVRRSFLAARCCRHLFGAHLAKSCDHKLPCPVLRQGPSKLRHLRRFISKVAFGFFSQYGLDPCI